jgi:ribosomal protein L29
LASVDPSKTTLDEIRKLDLKQIKEAEETVRRNILEAKMDIYTAPSAQLSKVRGLRKALATIMTVKTEKRKQVIQTKARKK